MSPRKKSDPFASIRETIVREILDDVKEHVLDAVNSAFAKAYKRQGLSITGSVVPPAVEGNKATKKRKANVGPKTYTVGQGRGPHFPAWVTTMTGCASHSEAKAKFSAGTKLTDGEPEPQHAIRAEWKPSKTAA